MRLPGVRGQGGGVSDTNIQFLVGTLPDGRVLLDFRAQRVDHLKLTPTGARELADGLMEAAKQAEGGRHILTFSDYNPDRTR